ncbi:MAG: pyrroline-5-carboxylate reductase dimerization domain-containing protein [Pseudomonadota bacterium]|nr:pyrroline-5-carboxylate reductase dimerization domain-containing protein [Pseudomonadota bacterium]
MNASLLIGCGSLGKIILDGFHRKKEEIIVFDKDSSVLKKFKLKYKKIKFFNDLKQIDWKVLDYIMICVKPNNCRDLLSELKEYCVDKHIIISFVAGLQTKTIRSLLKKKHKRIVRIMPNIFISSNNSATAIFSNTLEDKHKKRINIDFSHFGSLIWVKKENRLDFFTALFGGGPAYIFYILLCFQKILIRNGFNPKDSIVLLTSLLEGTVKHIKSDMTNLESSIKKVASKGGTTEEALRIFMEKDSLYNLFDKAINKATKRSSDISRNLE